MSNQTLYGEQSYGFSYSSDELRIECSDVYRRSCRNKVVEKRISGGKSIVINPVEPVNLPQEVTSYLSIEFLKPLLLEPGNTAKVFIKFPIEIGVFVKGRATGPIDIFTLTRPKYTLYGDPKSGLICRSYESDVYTEMPETDPLKEGIISLKIKNDDEEWAEIRRTVFDGYSMKIYYGDVVSMTAEMRVINRNVAETSFIDRPLKSEMQKAIELYVARKLLIERKALLMEWGF